ncbi:hypothetical protein FGO68_gene15428 [Halteria grandinella]|uniref:Uncharacterized protein n=1 Tax=Halteria grandinella TaxID=5974 RepID=A0A8J8NKJ1_HALGN|nr:hypothetical protein FGO68_gene15428 [Halteria grandinella]
MGCTTSTVSDEPILSKEKVVFSDYQLDRTGILEIDRYVDQIEDACGELVKITEELDKEREKLERLTGFDQYKEHEIQLRQLIYAILLTLFAAADGDLSKVKVEVESQSLFMRITVTELTDEATQIMDTTENKKPADYIKGLEHYINAIIKLNADMDHQQTERINITHQIRRSIWDNSSDNERNDANSVVSILLKQIKKKITPTAVRCSRKLMDEHFELIDLLKALQAEGELALIANDGKKCYQDKVFSPPAEVYRHIYGTVTETRRGIPRPKKDGKAKF